MCFSVCDRSLNCSVDGGTGDVEKLSEFARGMRTRAVHAHQVALLGCRQFRLLAAEVAFGIAIGLVDIWLAGIRFLRRRINARTRRQTRPLAFGADAVGARSGRNASGGRITLSGNSPKLMYPLLRDLVAEDARIRVPAAMTCRVLRFSTPG